MSLTYRNVMGPGAYGRGLSAEAIASQAVLRRFAAEGRSKLHQQGMTDVEIDAAISEALATLNTTNDRTAEVSRRAA